MGQTKEKNLVHELKKQGLSKWRIAKMLGVSWNTVYIWDREFFHPSDKNAKKLKDLLKKILRSGLDESAIAAVVMLTVAHAGFLASQWVA